MRGPGPAGQDRRSAAIGGADTVAIGCWIWGFLAGFIALAGLPRVTSDARLLAGSLSVFLPALAVAAGLLVMRDHSVLTVIALLVSIATPTYFFSVVNLLPLALAVATSVLALRARKAARLRRRGLGGAGWLPPG